MIGLSLTTILLLGVEARQDELFRSWEKAKADTRSLVVEYTLEKNDRVRNEKLRFDCTVKLLRTAKGELFAAYTETQSDNSGAAKLTCGGLLNGGNLYLLFPDKKYAMRFVPQDGDVRLLLERLCNPFALLLDENRARDKYRLLAFKQDETYTYVDIDPKQPPGGWMPNLLMRGRAVFMNKDTKAIPKNMPRQLWYEEATGNLYTYDIRRWKMNPADGPKVEEFTRPEDRPGWEVNDCPRWLLKGKRDKSHVKPNAKVGQIFIIGNDVTYQSAFMDRLGLFAGDSLTEVNLRAAEWRLLPLCLLGITCSVTTIERDSDEEYADILVSAKESLFTQVAGRSYNAAYSLLGVLTRYR
jgi:hypothetical protein